MDVHPAHYKRWKRVLDICGATGLLVASAPLMGIIAAALYLERTRPVIFTQTRVGRDGRTFRIYKFRTLKTDAASNKPHREQATPVGRWLRQLALDELPQLWNVLRGDMSLVGPRPTIPEQVARYGPFERRRLDVRPGLTGWAQIHGRNALSWPERIELDVWYVENRSLALDCRILARTPATLLQGTSTYGPGGTNYDFPVSSDSK